MLKNVVPAPWAENPFICDVIDIQIVGIHDDALSIALDSHTAPQGANAQDQLRAAPQEQSPARWQGSARPFC
jgi:hypothetical protein